MVLVERPSGTDEVKAVVAVVLALAAEALRGQPVGAERSRHPMHHSVAHHQRGLP